MLENALHHPNPFVRRGSKFLLQNPRSIRGHFTGLDAFKNSPPTLINSVPKSGTHLLEQIISSLPGRKTYGAFLASMTSSFTFKQRSNSSIERFVKTFLPDEVIRSHPFHTDAVAKLLEERNVAQYFIHRDPRDVVVSEAHYLKEMNKWHRLHRHFRNLPNIQSAIALAIRGLPDHDTLVYPDVNERYRQYTGWIADALTFPIRYEELCSDDRDQKIADIIRFFAAKTGQNVDVDEVSRDAIGRIDTDKSHTFRKGGSGRCREEFDDRLKDQFKEIAGELLISLGYESSLDW